MNRQPPLSPRGFTPETEAVAQQWFESPVLSDVWQPHPFFVTDSMSRAAYATAPDGELQGFIKPHPEFFGIDRETPMDECFADSDLCYAFTQSRRHDYIRQAPLAALEKIAADLAHLLDLPVAPVALSPYQNRHGNDVFYSCISLKCDGAQSTPERFRKLTTEERLVYFEALSRMNVFKAFWGHREQKLDFAITDHRQPVFFDHSLTHLCPVKSQTPLRPIIIDTPIIIRSAVRETSEKIGALTPATIREVVQRIPDAYLSPEHKAQIGANLSVRQTSLKEIARTPGNISRFETSDEAYDTLTRMALPIEGQNDDEFADRRAAERRFDTL